MICSRCGQEAVIWSGPMSLLGQHGSECRNCGTRNSQLVVAEEGDDNLWCAGCGEALTIKNGRWLCEGCDTDWGEYAPRRKPNGAEDMRIWIKGARMLADPCPTPPDLREAVAKFLAGNVTEAQMRANPREAKRARRDADAALSAAGYVVVPREPTEAMLDAAYAAYDAFEASVVGGWCGLRSAYSAMIGAALAAMEPAR